VVPVIPRLPPFRLPAAAAGATAKAFIEGGAVSKIELVTTGSGYLAAPTVTITGGGTTASGATATATVYSAPTEVGMVPAASSADPNWPSDFANGNPSWPVDGRGGGVPDWNTRGPNWISIGTEGGFLPMPTVVEQRPIDWNVDVTLFMAGLVNSGSLIIGPAERHDVIVDFSDYRGQTLILYNDAPAAYPAPDPRYDYFTNSPDLSDTGGYWGTKPGFGPNTRTIMQITVAGGPPAAPFDLDALNAYWKHDDARTAPQPAEGVFEREQDPIIVGQGDIQGVGRTQYNDAYGMTFPTNMAEWGISGISDRSLKFMTVEGNIATVGPFGEKAIQDEMGETFDQYGRMSGNLGVMLPNPVPGGAGFVLQNYSDPATEVFKVSATPLTPPISGDGTQIWKITHNGVDTHPIHFHLYDVQLLNRVGWDNLVTLPDANELGWKETVRVSPLQDTIVAIRPVIPKLPFKLGDSIRVLEPTLPDGSDGVVFPNGDSMFTNLDPRTNQTLVPLLTNDLYNFGWEYMWHCHILSHEEMMMMRATAVYVSPAAPTTSTGIPVNSTTTALQWKNNLSVPGPMYHPDESFEMPAATNFVVERATDADFTAGSTMFNVLKAPVVDPKTPYADQEVVSLTDATAAPETAYWYRVRSETDQGYSVWSEAVLVTTPVPPPQPTVTAPNGAEQWAQGSPQQITWTTATVPAGGSFRVFLRAPAGNFTLLGAPSVAQADTGTGTDFAMAWTPTQAPATGYMVRVWFVDAAGSYLFYDQSDAGFEIQ